MVRALVYAAMTLQRDNLFIQPGKFKVLVSLKIIQPWK